MERDGIASYYLMLRWVATSDGKWADAAERVIDGWSGTLTGFSGHDQMLAIGLYGGHLAQAAELLAYAKPDWPLKSRAQVPAPRLSAPRLRPAACSLCPRPAPFFSVPLLPLPLSNPPAALLAGRLGTGRTVKHRALCGLPCWLTAAVGILHRDCSCKPCGPKPLKPPALTHALHGRAAQRMFLEVIHPGCDQFCGRSSAGWPMSLARLSFS